MSNIQSIQVTYNNTTLHVLYIKENGKVKILTINKAHKVIYEDLLPEILGLVEAGIEQERIDRLEYIEEQRSDESRGN